MEWLVLVPLLNYIACAVEQKTRMDTFDITMLLLLTITILCGFLLIFESLPFALHVIILVLSFLCLITVTGRTIRNYFTVFAQAAPKVRMSNYFSSKQTHRKATLLVYLLIIMWYYPIVWILGAVQALDANYTFAAYMIGSIFGKVIFSTLVIESHVTLLYEYLITTASCSNLGEEDRVIPTSPEVTPKFERGERTPPTNSAAASKGFFFQKSLLPKIVPTSTVQQQTQTTTSSDEVNLFTEMDVH